jgi:hypothetical protein
MPPFGVRTFLWRESSSQRSPATSPRVPWIGIQIQPMLTLRRRVVTAGCTAIAPGTALREIARPSGKQCSIGFQPVFFRAIERRFPSFHGSSGMCTKIRVTPLSGSTLQSRSIKPTWTSRPFGLTPVSCPLNRIDSFSMKPVKCVLLFGSISPGIRVKGVEEKSLARRGKTNIVPAPPRLAE